MSEQKETTSGIGDPYFYEWSIGQYYLLEMLVDSNIEGVILQTSEKQLEGVDDVVIKYNDSNDLYVQVKHTRIEDNLTFSYLFPNGLIRRFAEIYSENQFEDSKIILSTNRNISTYSTKEKISLNEFLNDLFKAINKFKTIKDLNDFFKTNNKKDLEDKWKLLRDELFDVFKDTDKILNFLTNLVIQKEVGLNELKEKLIKKIAKTFSVKSEVANNILSKLDSKLREWVTTIRKEEIITREDVLSSIAELDIQVGEHFIEPPVNFFNSRNQTINSIKKALQEENTKIVFLTGQAGIGKTTIISKLKYDNYISFRYYAYKPITPHQPFIPSDYDKLVDERTLWNDLLIQIREKYRVKNLIAEYNVPVINNLLTTIQLREQVLRLSSILSTIENRNVIIVIDGIDHAARAGIEKGFVNKLIPPDCVPTGVKFIVSGQPSENYSEYPNWLKNNHSMVQRIDIKNLDISDISILTNSLSEKYNLDILNRIIHQYTEGNTLSVIFAVEEAKLVSDIIEFEKRLKERELSIGLDNYYHNIWTYALHEYKANENISNILSIIFSQTEDKISSELLNNIFNEYEKEIWNSIFYKLKPIINYDNGYYLRFNDIRIFLSNNFIKNTPEYYEILGKLVDYYIETKDIYLTKQKYLLDFMKILNRESEFPALLTTEFVINSYNINLPISHLLNLLNEAIKIAINNQDFEKIIDLQVFSTSLDLLNRHNEFYEEEKDKNKYKLNSNYSHILKSELLEISLDIESINTVVQDINDLITAEKYNRAKLLFNKWFSKDFLMQVLYLTEKAIQSDEHKASYEIAPILDKFGKILFQLNINYKIDIHEDYKMSLIYMYTSYLKECDVLINDVTSFKAKLDNIPFADIKAYLKLIRVAFKDEKVEVCKTILDRLANKKFSITSSTLIFLSIILDYQREYYFETISEDFNDFGDYSYPHEMEISFISGYCDKDLTNKKYHHNDSELILINGFKKLGLSFKTDFKDLTILDINEALSICILNIASNAIFKGDKLYLRLIVSFFEKFPAQVQSFIINEFSESLNQENYFPRNFEIISQFLIKIGEVSNLKLMYKKLFSQDSFLFEYDLRDRNIIINRFFDSSQIIFTKNEIQFGKGFLKEFPIGYTNHKEYSLNSLGEIYSILCNFNKTNWKKYSSRLFSLNSNVSEISDNRLSSLINRRIFKSVIKDNFSQLFYFVQIDKFFFLKHRYELLDSINELIEENFFSRDEINSLWSFFIGNTVPIISHDTERLFKFKKNIEKRGYGDIVKDYKIIEKESNNTYSEDIINFTELTLDDLFFQFEHSKDYSDYKYGQELLRRLEEKISFQSEYESVLKILLTKDIRYSFTHSGYAEIAETLFSKLTSIENKWVLISKIFEKNEEYIYELNNKIEFVSRCFLNESCEEIVEKHYMKISKLHESIIESRILKPINYKLDFTKKNNFNSCFEVYLSKILLMNLQSDSSNRVEYTLKGLYELFKKYKNIFPEILEYYGGTNLFNKQILYFLFMKIARIYGNDIKNQIDKIEELFNKTNSIYEKLGLLLVLINYQLSTNTERFNIEWSEPITELKDPVQNNREIAIFNSNENDRLVVGEIIISKRLRFLELMIKDSDSIDEFKQYTISNVQNFIEELDFYSDDINYGMKRVFSNYEISFDKVLYQFIYNSVPKPKLLDLVQGIFYTTNESVLFYNYETIEETIFSEKIFNYSEQDWKELLHHNLKDDEVILAASIVGLLENKYQEIFYNSYIDSGPRIDDDCVVFNPPEIFLSNFIDSYVDMNFGNYLFGKNVGISLFQNDSIYLFPTTLLTKGLKFNSEYINDNIVLKNSEGDIIRLEILIGTDNISPFSQNTIPHLQRWVCKKDLAEKLTTQFDLKFEFETNLNPK